MMAQPVFLQHLVQLEGVKEVPKSFIQPLDLTPPTSPTQPSDSQLHTTVPIIDLAGLHGINRPHTMASIHEACQQWGFFQVVNYGIPLSLIKRVKDGSREFFELPLEEKLKYAMKPGDLQGYGRHHFHREDVVPNWVDCLVQYAYPLSFRDVQNTWPAKPPQYFEVMDGYAKEIKKLTFMLLDVFCENLGLPPSYLEKAFGEFTLVFRVNYYPPCPQPHLVLGQRSHSDLGCITFLLQDEVAGLQVKKDGNWLPVEPVPDAIVINLADMMQIITNHKYVSVEHRVVANKFKKRMSIAAFYTPSLDALISPAPLLLDRIQPALYQQTNYGAYTASYVEKPKAEKSRVESRFLQDMHHQGA